TPTLSPPLPYTTLFRSLAPQAKGQGMPDLIAKQKQAYRDQWLAHDSGDRVNPGAFFKALREQTSDDTIVVADDGNHTYLVAELMPIHGARRYISPTDFNVIGYCVSEVIGGKLANTKSPVVRVVGDGGLLMTGMEMITAVRQELGVVVFVLSDGELSQIAQAQEIPYNRKTCTVLHEFQVKS